MLDHHSVSIDKMTKRMATAKRIEHAANLNIINKAIKQQTKNKAMKRCELLKPGYRAQNGYIFTEYDCKEYNVIQDEINRFEAAGMPLRYGIIDMGYIVFKQITGMK